VAAACAFSFYNHHSVWAWSGSLQLESTVAAMSTTGPKGNRTTSNTSESNTRERRNKSRSSSATRPRSYTLDRAPVAYAGPGADSPGVPKKPTGLLAYLGKFRLVFGLVGLLFFSGRGGFRRLNETSAARGCYCRQGAGTSRVAAARLLLSMRALLSLQICTYFSG